MSVDVRFLACYSYNANFYDHSAARGVVFSYCQRREVVGVASRLNGRQQQFVQEYLLDRNAEQAAIRAGYSPRYARGNAHKLVANSGIAAEIRRLGQKTAQKLEITRESIMRELAAVGFACVTDFVSVETESATKLGIHPLTGEAVKLPGGYQQTVRITNTCDLPASKAAALAGIKQGANGIEVRLHDKVRALELLGKAVGVFDNTVTPAQESNLFEAIIESAQEGLETNEIPEIKQEAIACDDVVE